MNLPTTHYQLPTNRGFTLIELLLVMAIISILSSAIFFNRNQATDTQALNQAAQKLAFDIRKAQTLSLAGLGLSVEEGKCGYGIHIENSTYGVYIYNANDGTNCNDRRTTKDETTKKESIDLSKNKIIVSLNTKTKDGTTDSPTTLDIVFFPPKPTIIINGDSNNTSATITLTNAQGQEKKIEITNTGQVNIK